MAYFPAIPSSLSTADMLDLVVQKRDHNNLHSLKLLQFFANFSADVNERITLPVSNVWKQQMKNATNIINMLTSSVLADMTNEQTMKAFNTILLTAFATNQSPTLDAFRLRARELAFSNQFPFTIPTTEKEYLSVFIAAVFLFWLSYDQLDTEESSRSIARQSVQTTMELSALTDSVNTRIMSETFQRRFQRSFVLYEEENRLWITYPDSENHDRTITEIYRY